MKGKLVLALALLAGSLPALAAQVQSAKKVSDGVYDVVIDGVRMRAYSAEQLRKKLESMSELEAQIKALKKLDDAQKGMIKSQQEQLARMDAQIKDYRTTNSKLEQLLKLGPSFSATAGLGYVGSQVTGMLGVGYGNWRLMGLVQSSSAGFMLSRDF